MASVNSGKKIRRTPAKLTKSRRNDSEANPQSGDEARPGCDEVRQFSSRITTPAGARIGEDMRSRYANAEGSPMTMGADLMGVARVSRHEVDTFSNNMIPETGYGHGVRSPSFDPINNFSDEVAHLSLDGSAKDAEQKPKEKARRKSSIPKSESFKEQQLALKRGSIPKEPESIDSPSPAMPKRTSTKYEAVEHQSVKVTGEHEKVERTSVKYSYESRGHQSTAVTGGREHVDRTSIRDAYMEGQTTGFIGERERVKRDSIQKEVASERERERERAKRDSIQKEPKQHQSVSARTEHAMGTPLTQQLMGGQPASARSEPAMATPTAERLTYRQATPAASEHAMATPTAEKLTARQATPAASEKVGLTGTPVHTPSSSQDHSKDGRNSADLRNWGGRKISGTSISSAETFGKTERKPPNNGPGRVSDMVARFERIGSPSPGPSPGPGPSPRPSSGPSDTNSPSVKK